MNKRLHRLVFDRRRSMRVPAAEHTRGTGKAGGGETRAVTPVAGACSILVTLGASLMFTGPTMAQQRSMGASVQRSANAIASSNSFANLPVRSTASARLVNDLGRFDVSSNGRAMTVKQWTDQIIVNWDSFNLGSGYSIEFVQPSSTSSALNNIWSNDPSIILGHIKSNGEVILQNANGILFGPTARVDTGRFVATALSLAKDTFTKGLRAIQTSDAAFGSDKENANGFITIERGAEIKALAGGDVIMVAPKVYNEGRIETPSGQTILAAGQKVYLYANTQDTIQRGLLVAVDAFSTGPADVNTVEQAAAGSYQVDAAGETTTNAAAAVASKINQVIAEKGTINLVGMTVRQNGVLSATTAVKGRNGAIFLQAMQNTVPITAGSDNKGPRVVGKLGTVDVGSGSITSVTPDAGAATQTSSEAFYRSRINIDGKDVRIRDGALVQAVSGNIQIRASENASGFKSMGSSSPSSPDQSTLIVDSGATLSVAGLRDVALPMSRNQLTLTPFQIELADSPVQRNGVIYRQDILADARRHVQIADVTGFYNLIGRTAQELSTRGGNIVLASSGSTVVADGARLNISGGSVRYEAGQIYSSLLNSQGRLIAIEDADPTTRYSALINPDEKSSTLQTIASYAEGADAGTLSIKGSAYYFGGNVDGSVVVGPLQRGGAKGGDIAYASMVNTIDQPLFQDELGWSTTLKSQPWLYASLQPQAGTLAFGQMAGNAGEVSGSNKLHIVSGPLNSVPFVPEAGTDAANTLFSQLAGEVRVSAAMIQAGGLGNLQLNSGSAISMDADVRLNLGASGSFTANSGNLIRLAGQLYAEGGQVTLASSLTGDVGVTLAPGAVIDVSGRVADERKSRGQDAVNVSGGTISVASAGSIDVSGAALDVSGGLWFAGATRNQGKAGSISMTVNKLDSNSPPRDGQLLMSGTTLSGYDFASGGALTISGVRTIGIGTVPQGEQDKWDDGLLLSSNFFSLGGFGTFKLSALGDVEVFSGTQVNARMQNLFAPTKARYLAGESAVANLQTLTLADGLRSGVNISLTASQSRNRSISLKDGLGEFAQRGSSLKVDQGALIDVGVGGSINMTAGLSIDVGGTLVAHGGSIALKINAPRFSSTQDETVTGNKAGYIPEEEIRLKSGSLLDVSGASKIVENLATHRRTGTVYGGGSITLGGDDKAGSIFTEVNSLINISGIADLLSVGTRDAQTALVSKGAGSLAINTTDGYILQGNIQANRPNATVSGGAFSASVSLFGGNDVVATPGGAVPYPTALHETLLLGSTQDVVNYAYGEKHAMYGLGLLSTELLQSAGFDRISLTADDRITLGSGANFLARSASSGQPLLRSLTLNTHALVAGDNQTHTLEAGRVALGSADMPLMYLNGGNRQASELSHAVSSSGSATLDVHAGLIELNGYLGLAGFGTTNLSATLSADQTNLGRQDGEIRLIGRAFSEQGTEKASISGQLNFAGDLNLTAGAVYATTLSNYTLKGDSGNSELTVLAPAQGSMSAQPLTALGQLTLDAQNITLDGPIYQTFGQVNLTARETLKLGDHARVSVSGDGVIVPVGMTLNGAQWAYNTSGTKDGITTITGPVMGLDDVSLLKSIDLNGQTISLSGQATLSAKAGGDLQAWEFVPGVGGSVDELNKAGYFAILPNYKYDFAPYDTEIAATQKAIGTTLNAGDQVTISTANSLLSTGVYTLLPARYALLPGAVLVKATTLTGATALGQAAVADDGSQVVSGYVGSLGTAIGSNAYGAALTLIPQATLMARSKYELTSINGYKSASGDDKGTPGSAGRISLASDNAFNVGAHFELNGGGELDLYMGQKMALVAKAGDTVTGYAAVSAQALEASGAQRVLLGGKRDGDVGDSTVTALSDEVLWATSIDTSTELITVAKDKVAVADGVTLKNHGAADDTEQSITLKGKGAALALTDRVNTSMTRDLSDSSVNPSALGTLAMGNNVTLSAQSVLLDAVALTDTQGNAGLPSNLKFGDTRALSLGAGQILLGQSSDNKQVLALTGSQLGTLSQIERLSLHATQSITTSGSLNIGSVNAAGVPVLQALTLDAPTLVGTGQAGDHVVITAQQVNILNSGVAAASVLKGQSDLTIVSKPALNDVKTGGITLGGDHDQQLAFNGVTLNTTGDVVIDGKASTLSTQGDLTIQAARVTGTNLANKTLKAGGVLTVAAVTPDRHTLNEQRGAGQTLSLQGTRVIQAGVIDLASGRLNVKATGAAGEPDSIIFAEGATTNVSGRNVQAGTNWSVSSAGGTVSIQADAGRVVLDGSIDVSAGAVKSDSDSAKSAGEVMVSATGVGGEVAIGSKASISGHAQLDSLSGTLSIDTLTLSGAALGGSLGTLDRVAELVNVGQMAGELNLRVRQGDQSLGTLLRAQRVNISSDEKSLTLLANASIDARAPQGGVVQLFAHDDLTLMDGSSIKADSSRAGANGGDVLLSSVAGHVVQGANASVSALGDDALDGRIVVRAAIDQAALKAAQIDPAKVVKVSIGDAKKLQAGEVTVEAVQVFSSDTDASLFALLDDTSSSDALNAGITSRTSAFAKQIGAIYSALGLNKLTLGQGHVRLGVELQSTGDITLGHDWNLADLRLAGEPIMLTMRAGGNLNIQGNLSDGFASAGRAASDAGEQTAMIAGEAASLRLVGGADLMAANVMGTKSDHIAGDVIVGSDKQVRTTAGSIDIAASHDVKLEGGVEANGVYTVPGTVYVAGRPLELAENQFIVMDDLPLAWTEFTEHGGRLEVAAGHDVSAPGMTQLPGNWLYHAGGLNAAATWWTGFDSFKQGFGSFGGGNIRVAALGDVLNAGVVAPTSQVQLDAQTMSVGQDGSPSYVDHLTYATNNGGDVTVKAGGDVQGGVFLLGRGQGLIKAGGDITTGTTFGAATTDTSNSQNIVMALMDGQWSVESRGDLNMGLVYNPTITSTNLRADYATSYFYTYEPDSALNLASAGGSVTWTVRDIDALLNTEDASWYNYYANAGDKVGSSGYTKLASVAPPIVHMAAGGGDLNILTARSNLVLYPSALGDLSLYAAGNLKVSLQDGVNVSLVLADSDPSTWPTVVSPLISGSAGVLPYEVNETGIAQVASRPLHQDDTTPVRLYAGADMVLGGLANSAATVSWVFPKAAEIEAGGTLYNPVFFVEHFTDQDRSVVRAGGDIDFVYDSTGGGRFTYSNGIDVSGPGELRVEAGRNMNLNQSSGVVALGNQRNSALPEASAKLSLLAGGAKQVSLPDFLGTYVNGSEAARNGLVDYVNKTLNLQDDAALTGPDAYARAVALYAQMSTQHRVAFADKLIQQRFIDTFLAPGQPYASAWQAAAATGNVSAVDYGSNAFLRFKNEVLMAEVDRLGKAATAIADSTDATVNAQNQVARQAVWDELNRVLSLAGLGNGFTTSGNINVASSLILTQAPGNKTQGGVDLYAPGGNVIVGLAANDKNGAGIVTQEGGSIRSVLKGDFQVNSQKVFVVGTGDLTIYASQGAIDSGRGSNTAVSAPQAQGRLINGYPVFVPGPVTTGSGLGLLNGPDGASDGDINLFAPIGGILALDTYIRNQGGGTITVAGPIKGADNLKGSSVASTAAVAAPSTVGNQMTPQTTPAAGATADVATARDPQKTKNSLLTVELLSIGNEPGAGTPEIIPECTSKDCKKQ